MKPSWNDAPDWARFLAMDKNEEWYWYQEKPNQDGDYWMVAGGKFEYAGDGQTLPIESRP